MSDKRKKLSNVIMCIGVLFVASAVVLAAYNVYDESRAAKSVETIMQELLPEIPEYNSELFYSASADADSDIRKGLSDENGTPLYVLNPEVKMPTVTVSTFECIGVLTVPSLDLELPIIDGWSYNDLRAAPCCYSGSAYNGNFVICAHNYAEHFGNIQNLTEGDKVYFTDIDGNIFSYTVSFTDLLMPYDVDDMVSDEYDLTLFTCNFTGQERVTVRCVGQ